ncbi:MAG TPA: hypothetical protein VGL71_05580 [Urbifossiella sp.]
MTSQKQIAANKRNALRSTGPRTTAGKAIVAANATRTGLHAAKQLVLASLGETAADYDTHAAAIAATFVPVGALEEQLADTIASITWRLRRIPQFEVAASQPPTAALPAHPDQIEAKCELTMEPASASASSAQWLAHTRHQLSSTHASRDRTLTCLVRLQSRTRKPSAEEDECDMPESPSIMEAAGKILGWPQFQHPSPWTDVARKIGMEVSPDHAPVWTYSLLRNAFDHLAKETSWSPSALSRVPISFSMGLLDELPFLLLQFFDAVVEFGDLGIEVVTDAAALSVYGAENAVAGIQHSEAHLSHIGATERAPVVARVFPVSKIHPDGLLVIGDSPQSLVPSSHFWYCRASRSVRSW